MHNVSAPYGYPTPPATPTAFDKSIATQHFCAPRYIPVAPEARLGKFLAGSIQLTGILGTGAYGVVYSAVDIKTSVRFAVKALSKFNPDGTPLDRRQVAFQTREIRLHYMASAHQNVVSMLKIIDDPDCIYVILEYCPEGDLFYNITECGHYVGKEELAKSVFLQILDAVEHCHSLGIYHRDLKPENILVTDQGRTVKLADFGLATASEYSEDYGCGSTFYMSPECLDHSSQRPFYYCAPNDVWSLGVILVNLSCGRNPWKQASMDDSTYRAFLRSPGFLKTILPIGDELNDILSRIFNPNPEQRITLPELRQRILACRSFTEPPAPRFPTTCVPTDNTLTYVDCNEVAIVDDDFDYHQAPLSPGSSSDDSMSDGEGSDDGSLTSSTSSVSDLDEEDFCTEPEAITEPDFQKPLPEPEQAVTQPYQQEFYPQPVVIQVVPSQAVPLPSNCAPRFRIPFWDALRQCVPQSQLQHPSPFYHQVPLFNPLQRCY